MSQNRYVSSSLVHFRHAFDLKMTVALHLISFEKITFFEASETISTSGLWLTYKHFTILTDETSRFILTG